MTSTLPLPLPVTDLDLADLRDRVRRTRWAPDWPVTAGGATEARDAESASDNAAADARWAAGTDPVELRRLARVWAEEFDWRAVERTIAELPWHSSDLDGVPLAYLLFEGETAGALPIVLTNGWPSTALELVDLARRLSTPSAFGGDAADALTVVVPALPGFPFSPQRPSHSEQTHELWHRLMSDELGFDRYAAHGGDLGAGITARLAEAHPEAVVGAHLLAVPSPIEYDEATLTDEERAYLAEVRAWSAEEGAYQHQQQTRPLTLSPALTDSPVGLLAWIVEKYRAWSDNGGELSARFSDDDLLTAASLYWFTNSISTSLRPYWEFAAGFTHRVRRVEVPTALAVFPRDLTHPPRRWAERTCAIARYTQMPRGGHFAPHEEPALLAQDITAFLREVQGAGD